nr:uncharacterized protein LOC129418997 [Misgurnus anguillicaudatus]
MIHLQAVIQLAMYWNNSRTLSLDDCLQDETSRCRRIAFGILPNACILFFFLEERRKTCLPRDLGTRVHCPVLVAPVWFSFENLISPLDGVQWTCSVQRQIYELLMKHRKLEAT